MYAFVLRNSNTIYFDGLSPEQPQPPNLRPRELLSITIYDNNNTHILNVDNINNRRNKNRILQERTYTTGQFKFRKQRKSEAWVSLLYTLFIIFTWTLGVTAFAGPVMVLVVIPIERMVRLLGMLMIDPLGYQSTRKYKRFVQEEDEITKKTRWPKEVLKGMETSFLYVCIFFLFFFIYLNVYSFYILENYSDHFFFAHILFTPTFASLRIRSFLSLHIHNENMTHLLPVLYIVCQLYYVLVV